MPRLKNPDCNVIQKTLEQHYPDNGFIILDFIDWQDTYYYALNNPYHPNKVYIQEGAKNSKLNEEKIWTRINTATQGLVLYKENSAIHQFVNQNIEKLKVKNKASFDDIHLVQIVKRNNENF